MNLSLTETPGLVDNKLNTYKSGSAHIRISKYLFVLIAGLAGVVLMGWQFDIDFLVRPLPELAGMNPTTALSFVLTSIGFLLITEKKAVGYGLVLMVLLWTAVHLMDLIAGASWNLDLILWGNKLKADALMRPLNRMAPNTAAGFIIGSIILCLIQSCKNRTIVLYQSFALLLALIAIFSLLGYIYRVNEFYGLLVHIPMALHTAIGFFLFALGILYFSAKHGLTALITTDHTGATMGRLLLPMAILIPGIMGYVWLLVFWEHTFSVEFGLAVYSFSIMIIFVTLTWVMTRSVNEKDRLRKNALRQLSMAYTMLQASIESHKEVLIYSVDKQYNFLNFNSAFEEATHHAYGTQVKIGRSLLEVVGVKEDREKIKSNCDKALLGEHHTTVEEYGTLNKSFFETKYNPIIDAKDKIIGITVLSENITGRKLAEEEILALNKELAAFSYSVAHDLRAPLRVINGYTSILIDDYQSVLGEEGTRLLKVASRNADKMGKLIDELLNFSKLGRQPLRLRKTKVAALIEPLIRDLTFQVNNVEMKIEHLEDLNCDPQLMNHVFSNLISNAIKYSQKKEKAIIEINSYKERGDIVYFVKDNGAGFDMKYADKLFGVFQRLHNESEFQGTGVGLAIVHKIISKHGGKIWAEAEVDKGATFYFKLLS